MARTTKYVMAAGINQCSSRVDKNFFISQMTTNTESQLMNNSRRNTA